MPLIAEQFVNNAVSTLAGAALVPTSTTLTLATGTGANFPTAATGGAFFRMMLGSPTTGAYEVVICTNRTGDTCTITRGQEGTAAQNWAIGVTVQSVVSAASVANLLSKMQTRAVYAVDYGVTANGTTDDTAALQAALNAAAPGSKVMLPPGNIAVTNSIIIPPTITLQGSHANHLDNAGYVQANTAIFPLAGFADTNYNTVGQAVIKFLDMQTTGATSQSCEQRLFNVMVDCSNLTGTVIDGILIFGPVHGVVFRDVAVKNARNHGYNCAINTAIVSGAKSPYSMRWERIIADAPQGNGFSFNQTTDSTFIDLECITSATGYGYFIAGCGNSVFIGCRGEWNALNGFNVSGGTGVVRFIGCSTDRNTQSGFVVPGTSTGYGVINLTGCAFNRDGRNGGGGGAGYAGLEVQNGAVTSVICANLSVETGVDDNGTGTNSPQYGVKATGATYVAINSGSVHGNTQGWFDGGTNTSFLRGANVVEVSGLNSAPAYAFNGLQASNAGLDFVGHTLGVVTPREHGVVAWTYDPANVSAGQTGTAGTVYLAAVYVSRAVSVTKIYWGINTAGATPTAGQNFVGLYNAAGTLLASTGVDATVTTTGLMTTTITAQNLTPGLYWVGFVFNATTMPALYRGGFLNATLVNVGLGAASFRFATNGTAQTTLPATITPASNVGSQNTNWAAIG